MNSFRDPLTGVLKAWGYAEANGDDLIREEAEDFSLEPGKWKLVDGEWIPHEPVVVPQSIPRRQGLQALMLREYLDQIPAIIDAIPDPIQRKLAWIEFDESLYFERHRPMVIYVGGKLGLDGAGLDELFTFAVTL